MTVPNHILTSKDLQPDLITVICINFDSVEARFDKTSP